MKEDYQHMKNAKLLSNELIVDVVIFDSIGTPYTTNTMYESGMGGSEFQSILLLKELAKLGKKVICINNTLNTVVDNNILYIPIIHYTDYKIKCKNLIIHRTSNIPKIPHKKAFIWVTDLNGPYNLKHYNILSSHKVELITLCDFHKNIFPSTWIKHVLPFIIPDEVYNYKLPEKSGFVYASSIMKGYGATLQFWIHLKDNGYLKDKTLSVCLPGYDNPGYDISNKKYDINYLGSLPFSKVLDVLAKSEGMFYVNTMPETFGISVVLAEILGCKPYVYGINGLGSLSEVLKNRDTLTTDMKDFIDYFTQPNNKSITGYNDYKAETVMKKWLDILV